jgi:hypothetical protein
MKHEHKQILRNLRIQNGNIQTSATEKAIARNARKAAKPLFRAVAKLARQIRREVDATLAATKTWDGTFSARYRSAN